MVRKARIQKIYEIIAEDGTSIDYAYTYKEALEAKRKYEQDVRY